LNEQDSVAFFLHNAGLAFVEALFDFAIWLLLLAGDLVRFMSRCLLLSGNFHVGALLARLKSEVAFALQIGYLPLVPIKSISKQTHLSWSF